MKPPEIRLTAEGETEITLTAETERDRRWLDLGFSGMIIKEVRKPAIGAKMDTVTIVLMSAPPTPVDINSLT